MNLSSQIYFAHALLFHRECFRVLLKYQATPAIKQIFHHTFALHMPIPRDQTMHAHNTAHLVPNDKSYPSNTLAHSGKVS